MLFLHGSIAVLAALSSSSFAPKPAPVLSRRQAVQTAISALSVLGAAEGASAEMYGEGKVADSQQGAQARALKFAKAGEETEAFKKAEAKRAEAQRLAASGQRPKEETPEEALARLGLKTYK